MLQLDTPQKPHWHLVFTKPRRERDALVNLLRQGYEAYLPMFEKKAVSGLRQEALFPRYLFIHLADNVDNWRPIRSTIGVTSIVCFGAKPARVPDGLVDALRAREDESGMQPMPETPLQRGDKVVFKDTALSDYEAIFQHRKGADRVVVLMNFIGQQTPLTVPASAVRPSD